MIIIDIHVCIGPSLIVCGMAKTWVFETFHAAVDHSGGGHRSTGVPLTCVGRHAGWDVRALAWGVLDMGGLHIRSTGLGHT